MCIIDVVYELEAISFSTSSLVTGVCNCIITNRVSMLGGGGDKVCIAYRISYSKERYSLWYPVCICQGRVMVPVG